MKISKEKREKICEQILSLLYISSPKSVFTSHIAKDIIRDEDFVKRLLIELKNKNLVAEIKKNSQGIDYSRRSKWKLSDLAYKAYKDIQS